MNTLTLDGKFPSHPKVAPLSDAAFRLHLHAMAYCADHVTDGFVSDRILEDLTKHRSKRKLVDELETAKARTDGAPLWESVDGGWVIHDYLDWNDSKEEMEAKREASRVRKRDARPQKVRASSARTNGELFADASRNPSDVRGPSRAGPRGIPSGFIQRSSTEATENREQISDQNNLSGGVGGGRGSRLANDWEPSAKDREFAAKRGWDATRLMDEAIHFANHHRAKGTVSKSWGASWITWVMQSRRFERGSGSRPGPSRGVQPATQLFEPDEEVS